jgi:hypothetical protein
VHLRKIHLWKICHQQWGKLSSVSYRKVFRLIGLYFQRLAEDWEAQCGKRSEGH